MLRSLFPAVVLGAAVGHIVVRPAPAQVHPSQLQVRSEATSINDRRGAVVNPGLEFVDETGAKVRLGQFFTGQRPVILNMGYYGCPSLCGAVLNGLIDGLKELDLEPGGDFEIVTVTIDPSEKPELARDKKKAALEAYRRPGAAEHWHFLTGEEPAIRELADTVGFGYEWNSHGEQFDHGAGLIFLSPQGKVTNYLFGAWFAPRDLRLAIVQASEGTVGSLWDRILLSCYGYDPDARTYNLMVFSVLKAAGGLTVLVLGTMIFLLWRRERRKAGQAAASAAS